MVNFHHSAQNIFLEDGHILVAELGNLDGDYVESRLDLDYYIGNDDGSFTWGGEGFSGSASEISFEIEGDEGVPILRAHLNPIEGDPVPADLNLAEAIGNDNGTLVFVPTE